jgi:hypothetical protein
VNRKFPRREDLRSAVEEQARALRGARRLRKEFGRLQNSWSKKAKVSGILSERDLERYLNQ